MTIAVSRLKEEGLHWVGVDVAKATFDAAWVPPDKPYGLTDLREVPAEAFARTPQGVQDFLTWLDATTGRQDTPARVCMETTGRYSEELTGWMREQRPALQPAICPAHHTAAFIKSLGIRNKTDRIEARALAYFGGERRPAPFEPPEPVQAELRELSRYRDTLVREHVAAKNRAAEVTQAPLVQKLQRKRLRLLHDDIRRVEDDMKRLVEKTARLRHDIEALTTIYGVGFITAVTVLAELGDLRRFGRARQLTAFAGLSPRIVQSGTSVRKRAHLCKQGNPRARKALYLAAVTAVRGNNNLARLYRKLLNNGKPPMVALGVIMRKILTIMRAMLIHDTPYQPLFQPRLHRK